MVHCRPQPATHRIPYQQVQNTSCYEYSGSVRPDQHHERRYAEPMSARGLDQTSVLSDSVLLLSIRDDILTNIGVISSCRSRPSERNVPTIHYTHASVMSVCGNIHALVCVGGTRSPVAGLLCYIACCMFVQVLQKDDTRFGIYSVHF